MLNHYIVIKMEKIYLITTGGTIDKDYAQKTKTYNFQISEPAVKRILERVNPNLEYEIISILKKDSLDLTEEDRQKIYDTCKKIKDSKIIITHGTDTMIKTAEKLSDIKDKAIILVGAMKPEKFTDSDAPFNIGTAIGAVNLLNRGVYIVMNGRVYEWNKCRENKTVQFIEK